MIWIDLYVREKDPVERKRMRGQMYDSIAISVAFLMFLTIFKPSILL